MSRLALDTAVGEASAALTFADAIPLDNVSPNQPDRFAIDLFEPVDGRLVIELAPEDADSLASAAWGAYFEEQPDAREQFLFEFLNIIAGRYLALSWPDREIRIGFPQRIDAAAPLDPSTSVVYDVGGATVRFAVERAEEAQAAS